MPCRAVPCAVPTAGKLTEQAKDEIEENVSLLVRTITQSVEALKNGVMAAQQPQEGDGQPLINEQTAAHLHGAVSGAVVSVEGRQFACSSGGRQPVGQARSVCVCSCTP